MALCVFGAFLVPLGQSSHAVRLDKQTLTAPGPLFGLHPFPYDLTWEALEHVHDLAARDGQLAVVHLDDGIPWAEALADAPFPPALERQWAESAARLSPDQPVYVGLAPLATDRVSLAPPSQGSTVPSVIAGARFDSAAVKTAYLTYARRVVRRFAPRYLNLGIEAGELAAQAPEKWAAFEALFAHVRTELRREYPVLLVGISFGLQSLMTPKVAERVRGLVDASDYVCLSFYPYASPFHEKFGAAPLPAPPEQWRDALAWAAEFTAKPLAICETGYSVRDVHLPAYDLRLRGSVEWQEQYVRDLGGIARRDQYLFVVWFLAVDYDALSERLPPSDGRNLLWQNMGLFDRYLRPRPAWETWKHIVAVASSEGAAAKGEASTAARVPRGLGPPDALVATASGSGVVLTWLPPRRGAVLRYAIAVSDASNGSLVPVTLTPDARTSHVVPGLPTGSYTFRVYAIDDQGVSAPSSPTMLSIDSRGSSTPGPPASVEVTALDDRLAVTWSSPLFGAMPTSYLVEVSSSGAGPDLFGVDAQPRTFSRPFAPGVYEVVVRAARGGWLGPSSHAVTVAVGQGCSALGRAVVPVTLASRAGWRDFGWYGSYDTPAFGTRSSAKPPWRSPSLVWADASAAIVAQPGCGRVR